MTKVAFIRASNIYDDSRASKEITALVENGYNVSVYGWDRSGDSESKCKEIFENDSISFSFYPVQILPDQGNSIYKLLNWIKWLNHKLKSENYDVIHACDLDSGISAYKYAKRKKCKLVYDIYDYYIDCHHVPSFLEPYVEKKEIQIINYADTTIICTEERKKQIEKSIPQRTIVIYNSPQVDSLSQSEGDLIYDYVYCGTLCGHRLLNEILEDYSKHSTIKVVIAGTGEFAPVANDLSNSYSSFDYLGTIPYSEVIKIETQSKVISAIYDPSIKNHQLCAPNKFYEALALGKPLIVCKGTGIDEVVKNNNIGLVIDYNSSDFYAALEKIINNPEMSIEMGKRARKLYETNYKWEDMKKRMINEYRIILSNN